MAAPTTSAAALAAATPASRDRFIDAVRAAAILVVVLGHWLIAVVTWRHGAADATNALAEVPALQWLTWVFQVMPLFFIVGGFANRAALLAARRRGDADAGPYLRSRVARLSAPVLPLAAAWLVAGQVLRIAGVDPATVHLVTRVMGQPLWFLAVYLLVSALAPLTLRLHERHGARVLLGLVAVTVANDLTRIPFVEQLNYLSVFLLVHQIGYFLGDGTLLRWSRRHLGALAAGGLVALALLTAAGPYPRSMVGVPGEARSNMSPPTLCIIALAGVQLALVLLARPAATRALQGRRLWTGVVVVNASIMTIFLWHLTALAVGATLLLGVAHFPQPDPGTAAWWLTRLPWLAVMAALLAGLVAAVGRFEQRALRSPAGGATITVAGALVPLVTTAAALTALAVYGFASVASLVAATALYFTRRRFTG